MTKADKAEAALRLKIARRGGPAARLAYAWARRECRAKAAQFRSLLSQKKA